MLQVRGQNLGIKINQINKQSNISSKVSSIHMNSNSQKKDMNKPPLPKKKNKNDKVLRFEYVCDQRKQNILNARFIKKKQKLFQMTKQNVRIFQRINSQKSLYSHESLNKSYESNKSIMNSRMSQRSNSTLKKSKISNCSKQSSKSKNSIKNAFFNRASSAKSKPTKSANQIHIRSIKRKSLINIRSNSIKQTKPEEIHQFKKLFNITEEPTGKQRNRPTRIRSTKTMRFTTCPQLNTFELQKHYSINQPKQIVINEQNQIQIHEQVEGEQSQTYRKKQSDSKLVQKTQMPRSLTVLEEDTKMNLLTCPTQLHLKGSMSSIKSSSREPRKYNQQNIENLFQIKNTNIKSRLQKKLGSKQVSLKYANLLTKINQELNKAKRTKQSSIYPYKSRLIA